MHRHRRVLPNCCHFNGNMIVSYPQTLDIIIIIIIIIVIVIVIVIVIIIIIMITIKD